MISYLGTMIIDPDSARPPWRQLADDLRRRIESGEISGRVPSEKTLAQDYGLAQNTVRKSLALLRAEGLIETTPGWGSYTTGRRP